MSHVVPPRFLFRWSFVVPRIQSIPRMSGRLLDLPETCRLPSTAELEGRRDFADVQVAWNEGGVAVALQVRGRTRMPAQDSSDRIGIWFDTRHGQTVHRATRFCQWFTVTPAGGGRQARQPVVQCHPIPRARDDAQVSDPKLVLSQGESNDEGYWIDVWFPAEVLPGFEPATNPRLGFHYMIFDSELGQQSLAVASEFPYDIDPSLWQTLELAE